MHDLRRSMEKQNYPKELREKVLRYYDYRWSRTRGIDEADVLQELPNHLCRKVLYTLHSWHFVFVLAQKCTNSCTVFLCVYAHEVPTCMHTCIQLSKICA
jgi:hypothetical protein